MNGDKRKLFARILACVLAGLLLLSLIIGGVSAVLVKAEEEGKTEVIEKTVSLERSESSSKPIIVYTPAEAFWEYPTLKKGEEKAGILTIKNTTEKKSRIFLKEIMLPFYSDASLIYVQHLDIVVKKGEDTLFDGNYVDLAESKTNEVFSFNLDADENIVLDIVLRCKFEFEGDVSEDASQVKWFFEGEDAKEKPSSTNPKNAPKELSYNDLIKIGVIAVSVAIVLGIVLRLTDKRRKQNKKK